MENANRRLQVPVDGRHFAYLLLSSILTFYLFTPISKYVPSAHLEGIELPVRRGGSHGTMYCDKDQGMFYYMRVLTLFPELPERNSCSNSSFETYK